jgi:hypothetical protein
MADEDYQPLTTRISVLEAKVALMAKVMKWLVAGIVTTLLTLVVKVIL